jgi:hypothetical protein
VKKILFAATLIAAFSVFAMGATIHKTAKESGNAALRGGQISLSAPHACSVEKSHPCVYYGGDIDPNDPEENGLSNENDLFIANSWTYTEVDAPIGARLAGAFSNNLSTYGVIDPKTANWDFRTGVSEGNGGTDIKSGTGPAEFTATGRNAFGFNEYELLTATSVSVSAGDVFFGVQPNCTNANDEDCSNDPRYFESDTDGLNGINSKYTVTSNTGFGPVFESPTFFGVNWASWCNDEGVACGDGMSAGVLQ